MLIRREQAGDEDAIDAVHAEAFARPDNPGDVPPEVTLVRELRVSDDWIPVLSFVADEDGAIVGHVVCTRAVVADRFPVLGLGPLGVAAARQRDGIGSALVHAVVGAADALDEPMVVLLGATAYYQRFGFVPASSVGVESPDATWGDHFQARLLTAARSEITGRFRYAAPFDSV